MVPPQVANIGIMLVMMQVSKRIPMEDPFVLNIIRGIYILSNVIILGIYLYMRSSINKKKDLTVLKYVEPPQMGSQEDPKLVTTTVHAYDLSQLKQLQRGQLMGVGIMAVMHLYFKYTNPLMIQSILPLKGAFESNLAKIHLFGMNDKSGDLKRPWKAASGGLAAMMGGGGQDNQIKTDKASIEAAEKAGRGGVKEE